MCGEVENQEHGILPCPKEIVEWQTRVFGKEEGDVQSQEGRVYSRAWLAQKRKASFMLSCKLSFVEKIY